MKLEDRLVSLVYLVCLFVWLHETNQMNKTDHMDQINVPRLPRVLQQFFRSLLNLS